MILSDPLLSPPRPPFSIHNPFPIPIHVFNFSSLSHLLFLYHELNCRSFFFVAFHSRVSEREREEEKVVWILQSAGKQQKHSFTFNPPFLFPPKNDDDDDDERVDGMMMMRLSLSLSSLLSLHLMMARIAIIKSSLSQFISTFHSPSLSFLIFFLKTFFSIPHSHPVTF